jgi:hypothetical protein
MEKEYTCFVPSLEKECLIIPHKSNEKYHIYLAAYKEMEEDPNCYALGKQLTAQYTEEAVLVYQAFSREIGKYAVANQNFVSMLGCIPC